MTDSKQFGNPKMFGDKTGSSQAGDGSHCAQCEAMLADALDGTLSPTDQELFNTHMAECGPCGQLLAEARRGAAFLEMLRTPAPQPPAELFERILAQTSGHAIPNALPQAFPVPAAQPGYAGGFVPGQSDHAAHGNVLPFPRRFVSALRNTSFGQVLLQPRLAMTAAMAFFSIALTMNITGVHLQDLRASDLKPSSIRRDISTANASVVRYYEGLRVVYELESRVHDMETAQDRDSSQQPIQANPPASSTSVAQPATQPRKDQQATPQKAKPQNGNEPDQSGSGGPSRQQIVPAPYLSRREDLWQRRRMLVGERGNGNSVHPDDASVERKLV